MYQRTEQNEQKKKKRKKVSTCNVTEGKLKASERQQSARGLHEGSAGCNLPSYQKQQQALEQRAQEA